MGFSPEQVDRMSLWQFAACVDGWNHAHGPNDGPKPPTPEEHDEMKRLHGDA